MNPRDEHEPVPPAGERAAAAESPDAMEGHTAAAEPLAQRLREAEDRVLRAQAELENFRKRSRREYEDAIRYREIDLLRDLLPVLDTVRRAIDASENTADIDSLRSGFRMTAQQLEKVLDTHGCQTIETEGKPFDPTVHDAILQQPTASAPPGTIVGTASRGYKLHERVVRPAQVIVATEP